VSRPEIRHVSHHFAGAIDRDADPYVIFLEQFDVPAIDQDAIGLDALRPYFA
jgi:hypothetical protein